ncbi:MAG: hypothetical protein QXS37_05870, partial [Candidatus Aenigmatarchaeota archaeon]
KQNGMQHIRMWRLLQQSDLLYYMCTKWWNDGDVHKYFSPFATPHDAFINTLSGLSEIKIRLIKDLAVTNAKKLKEEEDLSSLIKNLETKLEKVRKSKKKQENELKQNVSPVDFILSEEVEYPHVYVNFDNIAKISEDLSRRVK